MGGLGSCSLVHSLVYSFTYLLTVHLRKVSQVPLCSELTNVMGTARAGGLEGVPGVAHHIPHGPLWGDGGGSHWQAGNEPKPPKTQQGRAAFQRAHSLRSGSYTHSLAAGLLGFSGLQPT